MCGICGAISLDGPLDPAATHALPAMTAALAHRGPDGVGSYVGADAMLGHRRLAIIDRAGGAQPIANEDRTCHVVVNGEIYNHRALRRELEQHGHRFRTASDTEVVVHAYEEFGTAAAERLDGMFALAVYDERRRTLWMARDRLGKKPLYYGTFGDTLYFASEIGAFAAAPRWSDAIDPDVLDGYLALGYVPAPCTFFRHVRKLRPGHWLEVAADRLRIAKYWDIEQFDTDRRPDAALVDDLDARIEGATAARLESEVPLGAFLSGGIDSGLVVAAMAKDGGRVATTCVGFDEGWNDELAGAAATARRLGTDHRGVRIAPICDDAVVDAIDALDEPLADPSVVPTYHVSRVARESVVVALSGDGGDEAFGGYDFRYTPHDIESRLRPLARRFASGATLNRMARATGVRALGNLARDGVDAYFADLCFADGENVGAVLGRPTLDLRDGFAYGAVASSYRRCRSDDPVQRAMFADVKGYLADDVLVKVDRMSMRHGLEVRCPLLDHRIVELAFAIPAARKRSWRESKRLLRRVAARHLPPAIVAGAKRGFGAPTRDWLRRLCADRFRDEVLAPGAECAAVADMAAVRARFDAHLHGRADHAHLLWALWIFERWRRRRRRADVETSAA